MLRALLVPIVTVVVLAMTPSISSACATCGAGDRTAMGAERIYRNRFRLSLESRYREESVGLGLTSFVLRELRTELGISWAPTSATMLSMLVPVVLRDMRTLELRRETLFSLGDIELRGRFRIVESGEYAPAHDFGMTGSVVLPTRIDPSTTAHAYPIDVQAGPGSFELGAGIYYAYRRASWLVWLSALWAISAAQTGPLDPRGSFRHSVLAQWTAFDALSLRGGFEGRLAPPAVENNTRSPDTGGYALFAALDVLIALSADLLVIVGGRLPLIQANFGARTETPTANVAVVVDLNID